MFRKILVWLTGVGLVFQLSACSDPQPGYTIETLRIGILPDQGEAALRERFTPLFEFLSQETGLAYELVFPQRLRSIFTTFGQFQCISDILAIHPNTTTIIARHNTITAPVGKSSMAEISSPGRRPGTAGAGRI